MYFRRTLSDIDNKIKILWKTYLLNLINEKKDVNGVLGMLLRRDTNSGSIIFKQSGLIKMTFIALDICFVDFEKH